MLLLRRARRESARPAIMQLVPWLDRDEPGEATLDVARALRAHGWRPIVATAGGPLERELRLSGADMIRVPFDVTGPVRDWQNARALARLARQERVALLHARSAETAGIGSEAARRAGLPLVVTPHELPEAKGRRDALYRVALKAATRLVAVSEFAADRLAESLEIGPERIAIVPRWADMREFDPDRVRGHRVAAAAERCGLTVGPKVVGVPVEVAADDGLQLLVAAAARLPSDDFRILLLGRPPESRQALERLAGALRAAGLADRVRFSTGVDDLAALLALVDVLLVPATRPRPSAAVAVAAQAMGRPVIVTAVGGLPEVVLPAVTGWLLSPDDPAEVAWALELALRMDEDVRERVAVRAREFVASTYSAEVVLGHQLDLYAELSGHAAPARPRAAAHRPTAAA